MPSFTVRDPRDDDWPTILALANASVAAVVGAGTQEEWLERRRGFASTAGLQRHWVAEAKGTPGVLGYVGIEQRPEHSEAVRIFVVMAPADRETLGTSLVRVALAAARASGATAAWMMEYATDLEFITFLQRHGFQEARRLPLVNGVAAVVLTTALNAGTSR